MLLLFWQLSCPLYFIFKIQVPSVNVTWHRYLNFQMRIFTSKSFIPKIGSAKRCWNDKCPLCCVKLVGIVLFPQKIYNRHRHNHTFIIVVTHSMSSPTKGFSGPLSGQFWLSYHNTCTHSLYRYQHHISKVYYYVCCLKVEKHCYNSSKIPPAFVSKLLQHFNQNSNGLCQWFTEMLLTGRAILLSIM